MTNVPSALATQESDCDTAPLHVQSAAHALASAAHLSLVQGQQSGVPAGSYSTTLGPHVDAGVPLVACPGDDDVGTGEMGVAGLADVAGIDVAPSELWTRGLPPSSWGESNCPPHPDANATRRYAAVERPPDATSRQ